MQFWYNFSFQVNIQIKNDVYYNIAILNICDTIDYNTNLDVLN